MIQIGEIAADDLIQLITALLCILGAVAWYLWGRRRHTIGYAVAPMAFLLHRAVFYVVITADHHLNNEIVVMWSSAISLHSVITVASAAGVMLFAQKRRKRV